MGDKTKTLCNWNKSRYVKDLELLREIVAEPRYVCKDCGRAAGDKKWLCKPVKIQIST
jgi:transposase-like protein